MLGLMSHILDLLINVENAALKSNVLIPTKTKIISLASK